MLRSELARKMIEVNNPHLVYLIPAGVKMECQVNVVAGDGEPIEREGRVVGYSSCGGQNFWSNYRLPQDAATDAVDNDRQTTFPTEYIESVGFTGWDYGERVSRHVSFDLDSMLKSTGIPDDELAFIRELLLERNDIDLRTSKSNSGGFHFTANLLTPIATANHGEHADLARYILAGIADDIGYPELMSKVDVVGGNFWLYHTATKPGGLQLIKKATQPFHAIADDWRNHIPARPKRAYDAESNGLPLDSLEWEHKRHLAAITEEWGPPTPILEHNCYNTHTAALRLIHEKLKLRGEFSTVARGTTPGDVNCSIHPLPGGTWLVRRLSSEGQTVQESNTWKISQRGVTFCFLNNFRLPVDLLCEFAPEDYKREIHDPVRIIKSFFAANLWNGVLPTYLPVQGYAYHWTAKAGCWERLPHDVFAAQLRNHITELFRVAYLRRKKYLEKRLENLKTKQASEEEIGRASTELFKHKPKAVSKQTVANAVDEFFSILPRPVNLRLSTLKAPAWLFDDKGDATELVPFANGLVRIAEYDADKPVATYMEQLTPQFFNTANLGYAFNPDADEPATWNRILGEQFADDPESRAALEEILGLLMVQDTSYQKIWGLVGPSRSGRGTIMRAIADVIGRHNVASPTPSALDKYTVHELVDKNGIFFFDLRFDKLHAEGRHRLMELMLHTSGEDMQTDRDMRTVGRSVKLPGRIVFAGHQLPNFSDEFGAIRNRLVIVRFTKSYRAKEDKTLGDKLKSECAGIALVGIKALQKLRKRGRPIEPKVGQEMLSAHHAEENPVAEFVKDFCELGKSQKVIQATMFKMYIDEFGESLETIPTKHAFTKQLRATLEAEGCTLTTGRLRTVKRERTYKGIGLKALTLAAESAA